MRIRRTQRRYRLQGHMIRWLLIVLGLLLWFRIHYPANPWSAEGAVEDALRGMQMPPAKIHEIADSGDGKYAILLLDENNRMFHQMFVSRDFGLLWRHQGGGFGTELKPDVRLSFKSGMSTLDNKRHYYFLGQVHDPEVKELRIVWPDGLEQAVEPRGELYLAARSFPAKDPKGANAWDSKLYAYDGAGKLLYELNSELTEVIQDKEAK